MKSDAICQIEQATERRSKDLTTKVNTALSMV